MKPIHETCMKDRDRCAGIFPGPYKAKQRCKYPGTRTVGGRKYCKWHDPRRRAVAEAEREVIEAARSVHDDFAQDETEGHPPSMRRLFAAVSALARAKGGE